MDLRVEKTKKNIRAAFLQLRDKHPLEKIKVSHLCELALINKTTFYKHYQDIFALSEEIENETLASIMVGFKHLNPLTSDPEGYLKELYYAFKSNEKMVHTLFSGRMNILINKAENFLFNHYQAITEKPEQKIIHSFLFWGTSRVLLESKYDEDLILDTLITLTRQVLPLLQ